MGADFLDHTFPPKTEFKTVVEWYQNEYEEGEEKSIETEGYSGTWAEIYKIEYPEVSFGTPKEAFDWMIKQRDSGIAWVVRCGTGEVVIGAWAKT